MPHHVPQPHRPILAGRRQPPTVQAERHVGDAGAWPVSGAPSRRCVATSHSRIRSSWQPAAIVRPSGLNARALT